MYAEGEIGEIEENYCKLEEPLFKDECLEKNTGQIFHFLWFLTMMKTFYTNSNQKEPML